MKERLKVAVRGLPPKRAAAILASVNVPAPKRRTSPYDDKAAAAHQPAKTRKRKGIDGKTPAGRKPMLVLGR